MIERLRTRRCTRLLMGTLLSASAPVLSLAAQGTRSDSAPMHVISPDGKNEILVALHDGTLTYSVRRTGLPVIAPSALGFEFRGAPRLQSGLRIIETHRATFDESWTQPLGEVARVRDQHTELRVRMEEGAAPSRRFSVVFRAFDDGVAFRYELPEQPNLRDFEIQDELTEFALARDARAWWIPSNKPKMDRYEDLYRETPATRIDTAHTPLTMEMQGGPFLVIHEAALIDYAGMNIAGVEGDRVLGSALASWADGVKVRGRTPFVTPWRTIQLADRAADLSPSVLSLKLNAPSVIQNTSWIKPMKYVGIWWGMHMNLWTWASGAKHGATTEHAKQYIDFAAANKLGGVLVEGWNQGWDGDWIKNGEKFSFTKPYPDYDLPGVAAYAKQKGVVLIGHNETAMGIENYERQLDSAFALYKSLGITAIKTGYVTDKTFEGHSHTGQYMVRHYRKVAETAAKYGITVDAHEPIKDTGERRTFPNFVSREGARGQEYNAWSGELGNPPEHETILFFTRMLAGPMDFTPGIFDLRLSHSATGTRSNEEPHPRTTLAKQLALYVVLYSPVQMAADLIESYANQPAFKFVKDVAVDWDTTRVIDGRIGDFVIVARRERNAQTWFVGAITDEEGRSVDVPLSFLTPGKRYVAEVYADGPGANWLTNQQPVTISSRPVSSTTRLHMVLAPGGGQAIRIRPAP